MPVVYHLSTKWRYNGGLSFVYKMVIQLWYILSKNLWDNGGLSLISKMVV